MISASRHDDFERFVESSLVGVVRCSIGGDIIDANDTFLDMIGSTRDDLRAGRLRWTDLTPPEYHDRDRQALAETQATGRHAPYEKAFVRLDGSRVRVLVSSVLTRGSDEGISVAVNLDACAPEGTGMDAWQIAALKRAEAERDAALRDNERLSLEARRACAAKDEFIATLSHELRTPLNAIIGWAKLLERIDDPDQRAHAIAIIGRNARIQAQLLADVLDLTRLRHGSLSLDVAHLDVATIVAAAVDTMRLAATDKGILLEDRSAAGIIVSGDAVRLQQVVWNLLSNALKFTPAGGRIDIDVQAIDRWAEIVVRDTGTGIAPDFLPFVFDRFRQEDHSAAGTRNGIGLGLAIVRQIVELHGGTITATSAGHGCGATFTVRLPAVAIAAPDGPSTRVVPAGPAVEGDVGADTVGC